MKKMIIIEALAAVVVLGACSKSFDREAGPQIAFRCASPFKLETRTQEVTSLASFYVTATAGAQETALWSNALFSDAGEGIYLGKKLWPAAAAGEYHFYASNEPLSQDENGVVVQADHATDVVCAYLPDPVYGEANTLHFRHIFACIGRVTVLADPDCTVSSIQINLTPKTGGCYNLCLGDGHTDETGWSSLTTGASTVIASGLGANANDLYLVPGMYQLQASWTCSAGGGSSVSRSRSVTVDLPAGQRSRLSFALGLEVLFGVDTTDI